MPKDKELEAIRDLEQELIEAQRIELLIKSDSGNNPIQKVIDGYIGTISIYTSETALRNMYEEVRAVLKAYISKNNVKGRLLGEKAMEKFLDESEAKAYTQRALRLIQKATDKKVKQRLELAYVQLEKEFGVLKKDIEIFKKAAKIDGFTDKEILSRLVKMGKDKNDMIQNFSKEAKKITIAATRRERASSEIEAYQKKVDPNEEWVWVAINSKPCPDCMDRAGVQLPLSRWRQYGLPGSGTTICGVYCMCKLRPVSIAKDAHEEIKSFKFDKDRGVLTTAQEKRVFNAKTNQFK